MFRRYLQKKISTKTLRSLRVLDLYIHSWFPLNVYFSGKYYLKSKVGNVSFDYVKLLKEKQL